MSGLSQRRLQLQLERAELRLRSAAQRRELLQRADAFTPGLALADGAGERLREAGRWLQANPLLAVAGGAAAVLLLRPRRVLGWAGTALTLWSLWRRVAPLIRAAGR